MNKTFLLFIFVLYAGFAGGQAGKSTEEIISLTDRELAEHQVCALKDGALLIRIHSVSKVAQALRREGKILTANEYSEARRRRNLRIQEAFEANWDFCPVYFFEAESSADVREGRLQNVFFLGEKLERDAHIDYPAGIFYTAEFGTVPTRVPDRIEVMYLDMNGKVKTVSRDNPSKAPGGYNAFHVMNHHFEGLSRPFPYSVRTFDDFIFQRRPAAAVRKLNKRLHAAAEVCEDS